jgi:F-type H+-transporting ATPase subunit b
LLRWRLIAGATSPLSAPAMLNSLFLAVAEAHGAVAGAAETGPLESIGHTLETLGFEWHYIIFQGISFLILFAVLYKFGIKPTITAMEERQNKIESGVKYANDMKAQLASAQQESTNLIKSAQLEANKIIEESRKTAKDFSDKIQKEAAERANDQLAKAQQAIELEHKKMLADARSEIARLVVTTTERVLAKKLTEADRASYNETAAKELTNV